MSVDNAGPVSALVGRFPAQVDDFALLKRDVGIPDVIPPVPNVYVVRMQDPERRFRRACRVPDRDV